MASVAVASLPPPLPYLGGGRENGPSDLLGGGRLSLPSFGPHVPQVRIQHFEKWGSTLKIWNV